MSCERCGFENPDGFRFCGACGSPIPGREGRGREKERKVITMLFCDVVGSTERAEHLDPEKVHGVLSPYYRSVREVLVHFGGTVEKYIGDAVCGLFGAPRAYGDDPERAVRAALAVRDTITKLNQADPKRDLHVRLGVATGEAYVTLDARLSEGEGMAWGDVNNTAARLQQAAPIDAIVVDEATYRATRHAIDYGVADPIQAKGKSEPILVWQAIAPRARRGADLVQIGDEPLIGRRDDVSLLLQTLNRVGRRRATELVTVVGEPGIGKSRLVLELFRRIELSPVLITWRQARSSPYGDGFTFWALGEIVKSHAGILETDGASTASEKLRRAVRDVISDVAEAGRIEASLQSLVGIGSVTSKHGDQRQAAFAAWRRFLEAVARRRTLVLVFEDIHWADGGLLDFIEHVLDWARDVRILVLCTARPGLMTRRATWGEARNATTLHLAPLSSKQIRRLVTELGSDAVTTEDRESIVDKAAGNPLYAIEFVRLLVDRAEHTTALESVQAVIAARLDALPDETKHLLQDAAVVGRVVWPGVLAKLGNVPREHVDEMFRELVAKEYLTGAQASSVEGESEYGFRHLLVRDVAYEQISHAQRADIHVRVAEWLESLSPDRTADRSEMLAHHYKSAYGYAVETHSDSPVLAERARLALRDAGDRALSLNAFAAAERHYGAAVELWPELDRERPALLLRLGKARYYADAQGADVLTAAEAALVAAGHHESAAEAATYLALLAHQHGEPQERIFEHAHRAKARVDGLGASPTRAYVLADLAGWLELAGRYEEAIELASEALGDAEALELREVQALALATIGISRGLSGDAGGRSDLQRSIAITEAMDSHLGSHHCGMLADLEFNLGDLRECFELQSRARRHAERFGHASHIQWLKAELVAERYFTGRWEEAVTLAGEFLAETETGSGHFMDGYCRDMRGRIRLARGDIVGALDDSAKALTLARGSKEPQTLYPALAFRARALAVSDGLQATEAAEELLTSWKSQATLFPPSFWVVDLAWALEGLGRTDELQETAAEARVRTLWLEAASALASGAFDAAAQLFARIGARPEEALARLRSAQALAATGRDEDARRELDRAHAFFTEVGAHAHLIEAEAALVV